MYYTFTATVTDQQGQTLTESRRLYTNNPEAVVQIWTANTDSQYTNVTVTYSNPSAKRRG